MDNQIIPEIFKVPLAFTALEIPHMIEQRSREKELHEIQLEAAKLEAQIRDQVNNSLWSW